MLVAEVADALSMLSRIVRDTRDIVDAVNDGRAFLKAKSPDAIPSLTALLEQMQVTVVGLAEVTKLVSGFRFNAAVSMSDAETVRFNDYVVARAALVAELRGQIKNLKGSSTKVRLLRDDLDRRAGEKNMTSLFGLLGGKARERSLELSNILSQFYGADEEMINAIKDMLKLANGAIADVTAALGKKDDMLYGMYVPRAASRLKFYAKTFQQSQEELDQLVDDLDAQIRALEAPSPT